MTDAEESEAAGHAQKERAKHIAAGFSYAAAGAMFEAEAKYLDAERCYRQAATMLDRAGDEAAQLSEQVERRHA